MRNGAVDEDPSCETAVARKRLFREVGFAPKVGRERQCTAPGGAVQLKVLVVLGGSGMREEECWGGATGQDVLLLRG